MAQNPSRFCPRCGTPIVVGQRFCPNCGLTVEVRSFSPSPKTRGPGKVGTRLLVPGNKSVPPTYVKATAGIAPGVTQTSMLDFAVPTDLKISQLTLRLGTATEAQVDIPLTGHANLSAYQPKTTKLNAPLLYL